MAIIWHTSSKRRINFASENICHLKIRIIGPELHVFYNVPLPNRLFSFLSGLRKPKKLLLTFILISGQCNWAL